MQNPKRPSHQGDGNMTDQRRSRRADRLLPTTVEIKGRHLHLNDISNEGIGVIIDKNSPTLFIGEHLDRIVMSLPDGAAIVGGVVTHISETAAAKICGIRFVFSGGEYDAVMRFKQERMVPAEDEKSASPSDASG